MRQTQQSLYVCEIHLIALHCRVVIELRFLSNITYYLAPSKQNQARLNRSTRNVPPKDNPSKVA